MNICVCHALKKVECIHKNEDALTLGTNFIDDREYRLLCAVAVIFFSCLLGVLS